MTTRQRTKAGGAGPAAAAKHYHMLDLSQIPDSEYAPDTPVSAWLERAEASPEEGGAFPAGSTAALHPLPFYPVQLERVVGFSLYFCINFVPLLEITLLPVSYYFDLPNLRAVLFCLLAYGLVLYTCFKAVFYANGWSQKYGASSNTARRNQYSTSERNTQKYHSMRFVWPETLKSGDDTPPTIFCVIPHGVLPTGILAYPVFSKLFSPRLCRWTAAPIIFKIPLVSKMVKSIGSIPAQSKPITDKLMEGESDIGVVLDGIAGMFVGGGDANEESAYVERLYFVEYIQNRKGIVAIALKVGGVQIVPVYGFGHSKLWTVLQDPFGIMERISVMANISVVAFLGRWGWPFGPARREPVMVAFGDPIVFPENKGGEKASRETVAKFHGRLVDGFKDVFDTHKASYGWPDKQLKVV